MHPLDKVWMYFILALVLFVGVSIVQSQLPEQPLTAPVPAGPATPLAEAPWRADNPPDKFAPEPFPLDTDSPQSREVEALRVAAYMQWGLYHELKAARKELAGIRHVLQQIEAEIESERTVRPPKVD